jgi:superfamily II DNA or RNA helicase
MLFELQRREIRTLRGHYRSGHNNLQEDFFQLALAHCRLYQRAAGYFSSTAFLSWGRLLRRLSTTLDTRVQLMISPELSEADAAVLRSVVGDHSSDQRRLESMAEAFLIEALTSQEALRDPSARSTLLAWLLKTRKLELRFAIPSHHRNASLYHEKIGLIHYPWGDRLAFTGSANETLSGHALNYEAIDVYRSWDPQDQDRLDTKIEQFDETWEGRSPGLRCIALSAEALERVRTCTEAEPGPTAHTTLGSARSGSRHILYPFQTKALDAWAAAGWRGLLSMCTGSGKTVTAIEGLDRLRQDPSVAHRGGLSVIVACPTKVLVDQWHNALREQAPDAATLKAYEDIDRYAEDLPAYLCPSGSKDLNVVLTTYDSFLSRAISSQVARAHRAGANLVFVADEAHRLASGARLDALSSISHCFVAMLALTATPDIEGEPRRTDRLLSAFGGVVYEYPLEQAIRDGVLCKYRYFPRPVFLDPEISTSYVRLLLEEEGADKQTVLRTYREKRDLLQRSGHYIAELDRLLAELRSREERLDLTVVFSPPGRAEANDDRILAKVKAVLETHNLTCGSITAETEAAERSRTLSGFANRDYQVLLGIGCLDEGLDVPSTRRAIVLYSYDREKQFIQRRGRVLRRAPSKEIADIYDLILLPHGSVLPPGRAESLLAKETRRHRVFCAGAFNRDEALAVLDRATAIVREVP